MHACCSLPLLLLWSVCFASFACIAPAQKKVCRARGIQRQLSTLWELSFGFSPPRVQALEHAHDAVNLLAQGVQNLAIAELSQALRHARASLQQSELLLRPVRAAIRQLAMFGDKLQVNQASVVLNDRELPFTQGGGIHLFKCESGKTMFQLTRLLP